MSSIQLKAMTTQKKPKDKSLLLESSYIGNRTSGLHSSGSVAQFMLRSKGNNISFQMNPTNCLDLSLGRIAYKSPGKETQKKHIRSSKSCVKNCKLNTSENDGLDQSSQHSILESIYLADKKYLLSSSSKLPSINT